MIPAKVVRGGGVTYLKFCINDNNEGQGVSRRSLKKKKKLMTRLKAKRERKCFLDGWSLKVVGIFHLEAMHHSHMRPEI